MAPKLIILVTGDIGAGKDYCARIWATELQLKGHTVCVVSISDEIKREYALETDADLSKLLDDRSYKEQHRSALTEFWKRRVQEQPRLPEEHFLRVVNDAAGVDILIVTGMRDEAPIATFSYLVPESRVLDVRVESSKETMQTRLGPSEYSDDSGNSLSNNASSELDYRPSFTFINETNGTSSASKFAGARLISYLDTYFDKLANMVRLVSDFPRPGIEFRHVLGIADQPGGLDLCTSILQLHFAGKWSKVDAVIAPEVGGIVFASALALKVGIPLCLVREGGKLPSPVVSVPKPKSYITTTLDESRGIAVNEVVVEDKTLEMERNVVSKSESVVVVDDVLSTGKTLCAVLKLLKEAGVGLDKVSVMVVAEFPKHRGRKMLRQRGFGGLSVQSLLVFGGE